MLVLVLAVPWEAPAGTPPAAAALVARGAAEGATESNNQVKIVRTPAGLVVAYTGSSGGRTQVFLAISRDGGARWSPLAQASSGPVPSRLAALAADGSGRIHVIWTRYDDVGKIYYRVWAGGWTGPQARISPSRGYAGYPSLALDRAGRPQVVWYGIRSGNPAAPTRHGSIYEIYYSASSGRAWSDPLLISPGVPDSVNPALASDAGGRLHAAWYQYDGRVYQIRYAEAGPRGVWSAPEGVFRSRSDEFNPDLAAGRAGEVSLVWEHHDGQRSVVEYARREGGRWAGPVALSAGASPAFHPSVALAPSGAVYVAWEQGDGQIYLRRYAGQWGPVARLTADGGNAFPSVSAAGVVWTHTGPGGSAVYFARLPASRRGP